MNFEYKHLLPADFDENSRVWIYQSNRLFSITEALAIEQILNDFVSTWKSHGATVKGFASLLFGQFVIFMADERASGVSGCSTDSSVRIVKQLEKDFGVDMFNRQNLAFIVKDKIQMMPLAQLDYALENNFISDQTIYFNNLASTKNALENKWMLPIKESWLVKYLV